MLESCPSTRTSSELAIHVLDSRVVGERIPLEEYLETGMTRGRRTNSETRHLSGRLFGVVDRNGLEEAKRTLETNLLVGLTERFERLRGRQTHRAVLVGMFREADLG